MKAQQMEPVRRDEHAELFDQFQGIEQQVCGIGEPPIGPTAEALEGGMGARVTALPIAAERMARALGLLTS